MFYELAVPPREPIDQKSSLRSTPYGPPVVSDAATWSAPVEPMIGLLADVADVSRDHLRHRIHELIEAWGGLNVYGQAGADKLEKMAREYGLWFPYRHPHAEAALLALRTIAGELERSGRVSANDADRVLWALGVQFAKTRTDVDSRPIFISRPKIPASYTAESEGWLTDVLQDTHLLDTVDDIVLAEVSAFYGRGSLDAYEWAQMRLLGIKIPVDQDPIKLYDALPTSAPDDARGAPRDKARLPICRVERESHGSPPRFEMTIDPALVGQLRWRRSVDGRTAWTDEGGDLMATAYCWRDGAPDGRLRGDRMWGEGAAILLTPAGKEQLERICGPRTFLTAVARRSKFGSQGTDEEFALATHRLT